MKTEVEFQGSTKIVTVLDNSCESWVTYVSIPRAEAAKIAGRLRAQGYSPKQVLRYLLEGVADDHDLCYHNGGPGREFAGRPCRVACRSRRRFVIAQRGGYDI